MSIEKMIAKYNAYAAAYAMQDLKHAMAAERKAAWLQRCADRRGVRLNWVCTGKGYMHAGQSHPFLLCELRRRAINLDEEEKR